MATVTGVVWAIRPHADPAKCEVVLRVPPDDDELVIEHAIDDEVRGFGLANSVTVEVP